MEHGSDRLTEISAGILGNIACHRALTAHILTAPIQRAVLGHALWRNDPACLTEVCRLLSSLLPVQGAHDWLRVLLDSKSIERFAWIMENTLDNSLFQR